MKKPLTIAELDAELKKSKLFWLGMAAHVLLAVLGFVTPPFG